MNFGQALEAVKEGKLITRTGWNGSNMYVFQRPADILPLSMVVDTVKSLPQSVKDDLAKNHPAEVVFFNAYLCMKSAQNTIINGWAPSQTDLLAEDWDILNQ